MSPPSSTTSDTSYTPLDHSGQSKTTTVNVGMIGLGTVGTGVYKLLTKNPLVSVKTVAVKQLNKTRQLTVPDSVLLTDDATGIADDPDIHLVIELMGGVDQAFHLVKTALQNGKHVVTANKELIAKHGPELFEIANQARVRLLFEGAVAGGIPVIMPLQQSLVGNTIIEMAGILNGTTNYILTQMSTSGCSFETALKEAQSLGFAEADPTNDVEGFDVAYKISILSLIAFKKVVDPNKILREGITAITATDIEIAREMGYCIKLLGFGRQHPDSKLDIRVHPMLLPLDHPLASVHNEFNAIFVKGDAVGDVMLYGRGAGEMPTASAVCGDILAIATGLQNHTDPVVTMKINPVPAEGELLKPEATQNKYYLRMNTQDRPGVIGELGLAFGNAGVSIDSVMQKGINADGTAAIIMITQAVSDAQITEGLRTIERQNTACAVACKLRVL
ncbi:MAG: homoserine dehydrogenase [Cyanobacteria bacterium P01_H01_bin.74]